MLRAVRQVYGCQPKWKKLVKQLAGRRTEEKFDEVVQQLTSLTAQVWELQEGSQGGSTSRCACACAVWACGLEQGRPRALLGCSQEPPVHAEGTRQAAVAASGVAGGVEGQR